MVENRLICTGNSELISDFKKNIYIGDWCLEDTGVKEKIQNLKNNVCEYHYNIDPNKIRKDWDYLSVLYDKVMNSLTIKLNQYHNKSFSRRYWEIIAGPSLVHLLSILWDRWETLKSVKKNFKIHEVAILKYDTFDYVPKDFNDLFSNKLDNHFWNNCIYSEIIKDSFNIKIVEIDFKKKKNLRLKEKFGFNHFNIFHYIDIFLSKIIKEETLFYKFGRKKTFFYLINKLKLSRFYYEFSVQIPNNNDLNRDNLILNLNPKNSFEKMLDRKLMNFLPISHLESFKKIETYLEKITYKPKNILTTFGHVVDDLFKIWTANNVEKKNAKLTICSHGGSVENIINFNSWLNIADNFITWEKKQDHKCLQLPPYYSSDFKKIDNSKNTKILFCTANTNLYVYRIQDYILSSQIKLYLNFWRHFISKLDFKIKKNIVVRHIPHTDPWSQKKEFEKFLGKGSISKRKNFLDEVKNSKIIINTALQTTFFESMLSGVPTIVLLKDDLWNLSEEGKKIYNLMLKKKIIFKNISSLVQHLNEIDENPLSWWNSNELISVRNKFHEHYCNYKDNQKWKNFFTNLV